VVRRTLLLSLILLLHAPGAGAQSYSFSIPEAEVTVTIQPDGSALIHYELTFTCDEYAHPIDIVDIGMPNMADHEALDASIDGEPIALSSIRISSVLEPKGSGYEVDLGGGTIHGGETGVFTFTGRESGMVWQDTTDPAQASLRFTPTWFGPEYVSGRTDLVLRIVLPVPAADLAEVRDSILWQRDGETFSAKGVVEGEDHVSVAWARTVSLTEPNMFSVSFPKRYVSQVREDTILSAFLRWFRGSTEGRVLLGGLVLVLFGVLFFVTTRGTGWSVFLVACVALAGIMYVSPTLHLALFPVLLLLGGLLVGLRIHRARRKPRYFKAEICLEGGGVKRGLTAVQAAMLLEVPLSRVLTMLIFGLARKGVVRIAGKSPLRLEVLGEKKGEATWSLPDGRTVKLWPYEPAFVRAFVDQKGISVENMTLDGPFETLIDGLSAEMATFDLEETRSYYRFVVSRAWRQVKAETDWEARFRRTDKDLEWLMVDEQWDGSMRGLALSGHHYHPWWYHGSPRGTLASAVPAAPPQASTPATTSFGDVASGLVGRLETVSSNVISSLDGLETTRGVDLSSVDHFTMDALKTVFENAGSGGGGSSGGCACACAGCACACACAGGGR
jgi:hypothetical protein